MRLSSEPMLLVILLVSAIACHGLDDATSTIGSEPHHQGLRQVKKKENPVTLRLTADSDNIYAQDTSDGQRSYRATPNVNGHGCRMMFTAGNSQVIDVVHCVETGELTIQQIGGLKGPLEPTDRVFLSQVGDALEEDPDVDTDTLGALGTAAMRSARFLSEWPEKLDLEYLRCWWSPALLPISLFRTQFFCHRDA